MKLFEEEFKKKFLKRFFNTFVVIGLALILSGIPSFAAEKVYFYHTDTAGTPIAMTDASGNVVWRADYKPFGEEQAITGTLENNKQFIGKEKDKETGLYNVGVRYHDPATGRFTTPDPIGISEKDLMNPQRLNRYNYSLNNPYRYIDPNGQWAEDVHSGIGNFKYGTYIWAKQIGFSDKDAKIIARGNNATDSGPWTSWLPWYFSGDQSRHFNKPYLFSKDVGDTRDYWANVEFQRALQYAEEGDYGAALGHLGKGLHSLQDKYAHGDWDTELFQAREHPAWYDDWNDPRNKEKAEATFKATIEYLKKFKEQTE